MDPQSSPARESRPAPLHDLGVLFVHGIGQQGRGSTLVQFGEPLYRWLDRRFGCLTASWRLCGLHQRQQAEWSARHHRAWFDPEQPDAWADVHDTLRRLTGGAMSDDPMPGDLPPLEHLTNPLADTVLAARATFTDVHVRAADGAPSHAPLDLHAVTTDGAAHRSRWLLAEAWWAQSFDEPRSRDLAAWLITIIPWTLGSHFGTRVRRRRSALRQATTTGGRLVALAGLAVNLVQLVASLPAAIVAQVAVAMVVLVGLLPVPRAGKVLAAVERVMAQTLGDSLVLTGSPIQQAGMVAQVQRDVAWLAARCRTVAVVAHSQGGAVAHRALRRGRPPQVALLVTFGSGLRKLEEIEETSKTDQGFFAHAYVTAWAVALVGFPVVSALLGPFGGEGWAAAAGSLLLAGLTLFYVTQTSSLDISWYGALFERQRLWWLDFHASSDPVSNGALHDDPRASYPGSMETCNERSFLRDHTTYWDNAEEFTASVAWALGHLAGPPWRDMVTLPPAHYATAIARRRWRVGALVAARWATAAAVVAVAWVRRDEWSQVGRWLAGRAAVWLDVFGPGDVTAAPVAPEIPVWTATAGATAVLMAAAWVTRVLWNRWDGQERQVYFEPRLWTATSGQEGRQNRASVAARIEIFNAMWFYFAAIVAQSVVATAFAPALTGGVPVTWWEGGSVASGAGLAATITFLVGQRLAVARAVERAAIARPPQASAPDATVSTAADVTS